MFRKVMLFALLMVVSSFAVAGPSIDAQDKADAHAKTISDAEQFVDELKSAVIMAEDGQYGRLKRGQLDELHNARDQIVVLLKDHESATELQPDERLALFNAQEIVTSILRNENKNRKVCRRAVTTGSRLGKVECLTIAQIEERARTSRYATEQMQTGFCVPGEGQSCSK